MKNLINKLGGNVGHIFKTIIEELLHNAVDSIYPIEDLNILVIKKNGEIIICDNNKGCENIDSFFHSVTKKCNQIGRKNSGLKDTFVFLTDGFGEIEIFSRYNDNQSNVEHHIYLNMTDCTKQYNTEKSKYSKAANIDLNIFSEDFSENYIKTTYNYNKNTGKNTKNKKDIDENYNILIQNNKQSKSIIENIRETSGTIIRIKIDENQKEKITKFNENINKNLFEKIAFTVFNIPFTLNLLINDEYNTLSISENQAIKTYLGTDIYNIYPINEDCKLFLSILSEEEAKKQQYIYGEEDKKCSIQNLRYGAVSIDEVILNTKVNILCGPGKEAAQNIPNLRAILKIKTNSPIIDNITMAKKTEVNITELPRKMKDRLSDIRKEFKNNGIFEYQENIKLLAPNSLKKCDIKNVIIDINKKIVEEELKTKEDEELKTKKAELKANEEAELKTNEEAELKAKKAELKTKKEEQNDTKSKVNSTENLNNSQTLQSTFSDDQCSEIENHIIEKQTDSDIEQEEEDKSPSSISLNSENNIQDSSEESIDNFENAVTTHNLNIQTTNEAANSLKNNNVEEDIEIKTINNGPKIDTKLDKKNILITLGNISELLNDSEEFTEKWREKLTELRELFADNIEYGAINKNEMYLIKKLDFIGIINNIKHLYEENYIMDDNRPVKLGAEIKRLYDECKYKIDNCNQ